jgi:threonine dehydratase
MPEPLKPPEYKQIYEAANLFPQLHLRRTPLWDSPSLKVETKAKAVRLKLENLQRTGSFKVRGAAYKLAKLSQNEQKAGVIVASPGNLAQGVALAAKSLHIPCTVVMPHGTPLRIRDAIEGYGASISLFGTTLKDAQDHAQKLADEHGFICIPAFDDALMIAGHGTIAKEITDDWSDVDAIIVPVGSGGLISGIAIAAKEVLPNIQIIGVQAEGAKSAKPSIDEGKIIPLERPYTIADGINARRPGDLAFAIMRRYVDRWVTVSDQDIARSIIWLLERQKYLVEGAGAVGVAALQHDLKLKEELRDKNVAVVISGGNTDISEVSRLLEYVFAAEGRVITLDVDLPDRPDELSALIADIAAYYGSGLINIREVIKQQASASLKRPRARVTIVLEVAPGQGHKLINKLRSNKYRITLRSATDARNNHHEGERADASDSPEEPGQTALSS